MVMQPQFQTKRPILDAMTEREDTTRIERISDPLQRNMRLRSLIANECEGIVRTIQPHTTFAKIKTKGFDIAPDHPHPLQWECPTQPDEGPLAFAVTGLHALYTFSVQQWQWAQGTLYTEVPTELGYMRQRKHIRSIPQEPVYLLFEEGGVTSRLLVKDISIRGIGCWMSLEQLKELRQFGKHNATIEWDQEFFSVHTRIKHVSRSQTDDRTFIGMEVFPQENEDLWHELWEESAHPHTQAGQTWIEDHWDLFLASGFFHLSNKQPTDFSQLKKQFSQASQIFDQHPELGCQSVWPSERGVEATVSTMKMYEKAWLIYQVAKYKKNEGIPFPGRHILRSIFLRAMEHPTIHDEDCDWIVAFSEAHIKWNKAMLVDFADKYASVDWGYSTAFHLMEGSAVTLPTLPTKGLKISRATEDERAIVLQKLQQQYPIAYTQPLDLCEERFMLPTLTSSWQDVGLQRHRDMLVAKRGGQIVACAALECGSIGTSLFGLSDSVRCYSLAPSGRQAYPALLESCREWFASRGHTRFLYINELSQTDHATQLGFKDLGKGYFFTLSKHIIPDILEHIYQMSASGHVPQLLLENNA